MSAHTPGPWEAVDDEIVALNSDINIADVRLYDGINPNEWQANMRLIAAAPDLLAAAKLIASFAVSWQPLAPGDIRQLTNAIAKAEGFK
jgi:hypothetical protein